MRKLLVLLSAVALMVAFTVPAIAADKSVSFYGRVWMDTFIEDYSKEKTGLGFDDSELLWDVEGNGTSRFGAKFKWDSMSANVEIRPSNTSVYRQWWGAWNFGAGSLLVGHTWSLLYINTAICGQCEAGGSSGQLGNWVGTLRQPQVRLTVGSLAVALEKPYSVGTLSLADKDFTLPRLTATYALKLGSIGLVPFLGWQSYDEVDAADKSYGVDGMVYGITARMPVGPGYVNAQVWMSKNDANWGNYYHNGFGGAVLSGTTIKDEDGMGYTLVAGMMLSDTMKFEVGYGHNEYELDLPGTYEDTSNAYYAQLEIKLAKGFTVTPEFGKVDDDEKITNGVVSKEGDLTYYGAVWKIHF
jgi:hypothetical protein